MNGFLIILLNFVFSLILLVIFYFLIKKEFTLHFKEKEEKEKDTTLSFIEKFISLIQELKNNVEEKLEKSIERTAKVEEVARVLESYSSDLKNLKNVLAGTKSVGIFGERALEEILKEFPNSIYEKQFQIGLNRVDYVLKINETIIPIDSKFPYSSFAKILEASEEEKLKLKKELIKALKSHIDSIANKYIAPVKGTVEYAIMFIPGEGLFYEILSDKDYSEIWRYAKEKFIYLTSPKTFEILCHQLALVLQKQEFAQSMKEILNNLSQLEKDITEITSYLEKAKNQLTNSTSNLEQAYRAFNRFVFNFKSLIKKEAKLSSKIEKKEEVKTLL